MIDVHNTSSSFFKKLLNIKTGTIIEPLILNQTLLNILNK